MGKWEETQEAYCGRENPEEKVIPEKDKMGLVQALIILRILRGGLSSCRGMEKTCEALDVVLEWVNNLFLIMRGTDNGKR